MIGWQTILILGAAGMIGLAAQAEGEGKIARHWQFHVDLLDGSRLIGTPRLAEFEIEAEFGKARVPLERVLLARWLREKQILQLELENDDRLSGTQVEKSLKLTTVFGEVEVGFEHVHTIWVWEVSGPSLLPFAADLALYYSFGRSGHALARNSVNPAHEGVVQGAQWVRGGVRGGAIKFDGASRIEVPHHQDLCPATLTLSVWIKPQAEQASFQLIVAKTNPSSWLGGFGLVRMPGDPKNVYFFTNGYTSSVAKAEVPNDKWSHVAGVCDGNSAILYVDGVARNSVAMAEAVAVAPEGPDIGLQPGVVPAPPPGAPPVPHEEGQAIRHCVAPLWIGSDSSGYAWKGTLDELALFRRALNPEEVQLLFRALKPEEE